MRFVRTGATAAALALGSLAGQESAWAVDTAPPTITPLSPVPRYVTASTNQLIFEIVDAESPVDTVRASWGRSAVPIVNGVIDTRRLREARKVLTVAAADTAGNVAIYSTQITVDRTPPRMWASTFHTFGPVARVVATDATSGPFTQTLKVRAATLGDSRHAFTFRDRAGNEAWLRFVVRRHISLSRSDRNRGLRVRDGRGRWIAVTRELVDRALAYHGGVQPYPSTFGGTPVVREVQWRLRRLGYLPRRYPLTGMIDLETMKAIKRLQRDFALPPIATPGMATRARLDEIFDDAGPDGLPS